MPYPVCLCLTVSDLGTSTKSHQSHKFGCSTKRESKIMFTYRQQKCYVFFFYQLHSADFSDVLGFYRPHFRKTGGVEGKDIFTGISDRCDTILLHCIFINSMLQISDGVLEDLCSTGCTRSG